MSKDGQHEFETSEEERCKAETLRGEGEISTLMRALDWSTLPAGPVCSWPASLRTLVSTCLGSRHPIEIWWGPEYLRFYNDAYRPILGDTKHPQFIGRPGQEMWTEIWDVIEPLLRKVYDTGVASWYEDFQLLLTRNGFVEETYFSFSYGPVFEGDKVAGIFSACSETTAHVLQARRLSMLRRLSIEGTAETLQEALAACTRLLGEDPDDIPFALVYLLDSGEGTYLAAAAGIDVHAQMNPNSLALGTAPGVAGVLGQVGANSSFFINDLGAVFGQGVGGTKGEELKKAVVLPLRKGDGDTLIGYLIAGLSNRLPYNEDYRIFFDLFAAQVGNLITRTTLLMEERNRAERFAGMFDSAPAFIAVLRGPTHTFELTNPRYLQLVGYRNLIGQPVRSALPEVEGQGFFEMLDEVYQTGKPIHGDSVRIQLQRTPGSNPETRYITLVYQPIASTEERVTGIFVLGTDVTDSVAAQDALRRSEKLSTAGRLAATIAHEINNPLEAITNLLYLAKGSSADESLNYLTLAEEELDRISHITKQTLAFYKESTLPKTFDLSSAVETILTFYRKQAAAKGIELRTDLGSNCTLFGIEGELKQVFSNLFTNAMDAFAGDRGTIRIRTHKVQGRVRLSVSDAGQGITPSALAKIWEPFFTTKASVGTGLGLWVTREILTKHKAEMRLRTSTQGPYRGTTFSIVFPAST